MGTDGERPGGRGGWELPALAAVVAGLVMVAAVALGGGTPSGPAGELTSPPTSAAPDATPTAPERGGQSSSSPEPPDAGPTGPPSPTPERDPALDQPNRRLGLHVTSHELAIWRVRAVSGPYRVDGDVSPNSPGDWQRITDQAEQFMDEPAAGRWPGPIANNPDGCVRKGRGRNGKIKWTPPIWEPSALQSAAFYAMVADSRRHAVAVRDELVAQAQVHGVDFGDTDRWCRGVILDGVPGFQTATWLTKLLYAADYIEVHDPDIFSPQERALLDGWFRGAAELFMHDTDVKLAELFVDREAGDYRLTETATGGDGRVVFYGGPEVVTLQRRFNNRNARLARFVTLVGLRLGDQGFIDHGKEFVKDALRFAYYPVGAVGDFERWDRKDPIKGWKYGAEFTGALVTIADHLARAGDAELYEFTTTDGALGTEGERPDGGPKSLRTLVEDMLRYVDHTYERYGTDRDDRAGDPEYLIDTVNDIRNEERINDIQLVQASGRFDDPRLDQLWRRQAPGAPAYPEDPAHGAGDPEGGEAGSFPGVLFMFEGMDVSVYPDRADVVVE